MTAMRPSPPIDTIQDHLAREGQVGEGIDPLLMRQEEYTVGRRR